MIACPSSATLALLAMDSLDGSARADLEKHIEACSSCLAELERLARNDDRPTDAARQLPGRDTFPEIRGFAIESELGRGGMGVVYRARQPSLGRAVALKVVLSGPESGSIERARWLYEAQSFARVRHDHVVRLHDAGESNGWLYLVLELVPGGSLAGRLAEPYDPIHAARLAAPIARAVAAIHAAGLLHLDLKPSNILLDSPTESPREQAKPVVSDLGIARRWGDSAG